MCVFAPCAPGPLQCGSGFPSKLVPFVAVNRILSFLPRLQFGSGFLSKFECAQCDNRLLEEVTLVDTPGETTLHLACVQTHCPIFGGACRTTPGEPPA